MTMRIMSRLLLSLTMLATLSGCGFQLRGDYQLALLSDKLERRTLSLFESGQVAEYELLYQVNYQLLKDDQVLVERTAEVARDY